MLGRTIQKFLKYIGTFKGFSQQTPFFPHNEDMGLWHSPVIQPLIKKDLQEFDLNSPHQPDLPQLTMAIERTAEAFRLPTRAKVIHG